MNGRAQQVRRLVSSLIVWLALGLPVHLGGQALSGHAVDAADGEPIRDARVTLVDSSGDSLRSTVTDAAGGFSLPLSGPGIFAVRVQHLAYRVFTSRQIEVGEGRITQIELRLAREAIELDSLVVRGWDQQVADHAPEFHRRLVQNRRSARGRILTRDELAPLGDRTVGEALEQKLILFRNRGVPCTPRTFWNGLAVSSWEVPVSQVEGIEVYRTASDVPPRYATEDVATDCGVVLIWSRIHRPEEGTENSTRAFLSGIGAFVLFAILIP